MMTVSFNGIKYNCVDDKYIQRHNNLEELYKLVYEIHESPCSFESMKDKYIPILKKLGYKETKDGYFFTYTTTESERCYTKFLNVTMKENYFGYYVGTKLNHIIIKYNDGMVIPKEIIFGDIINGC